MGVAAGAAAAVALAGLRDGAGPSTPDGPAPVAVRPVAALPQVPALTADDVCRVDTAGGTTLAVVFSVVNASAGAVTLEAAEPRLSAGGLVPAAVDVRTGDCGRTGRATPRRTLLPGERLLVTFRFRLTGACPQDVAVGAALRERTADGRVLASRPRLLDDLRDHPFRTCR